MRRLVLTAVALAATAVATVPALAKPPVPPVPVGVGSNGNGAECVYAFDWVPQCVDTSAIGVRRPSAAAAAGIVFPYFQNPVVQTVAHAVCTRSSEA